MTQALADMRRDYIRDGLSEAQAPGEPFALFHQWFADAVKTEQPPVEANASSYQRPFVPFALLLPQGLGGELHQQ